MANVLAFPDRFTVLHVPVADVFLNRVAVDDRIRQHPHAVRIRQAFVRWPRLREVLTELVGFCGDLPLPLAPNRRILDEVLDAAVMCWPQSMIGDEHREHYARTLLAVLSSAAIRMAGTDVYVARLPTSMRKRIWRWECGLQAFSERMRSPHLVIEEATWDDMEELEHTAMHTLAAKLLGPQDWRALVIGGKALLDAPRRIQAAAGATPAS